jgi:hypothetical protein
MIKKNRALVSCEVHKLIAPFGGTNSLARQVVELRHLSSEKVENRLRIAENAGIIKQGGNGEKLRSIIAVTNPKFLQRIRDANAGMTTKQRVALQFLLHLGIPTQQAQKLCQTQMASRELFLARAKEIAKFELSLEKFGVDRIPLALFKHFIHLPPSKIRRYLKESSVLRKLENDHSIKILDSIFPVWSRFGQLKEMEPRTILAKVEYLVKNGISLHGRYIRQYSLEELAKLKDSFERMSSSEKRVMLKRLVFARKKALGGKK